MDGLIKKPSLLAGGATVHRVQCCIKATKHHLIFTGTPTITGAQYLLVLKTLVHNCKSLKYERLYLNKNSFSVTGAWILQALWVLISNAKCASNGLFSSCHRNGKKFHLEIYVRQRISLLFSIIQMLLAGTSTLT